MSSSRTEIELQVVLSLTFCARVHEYGVNATKISSLATKIEQHQLDSQNGKNINAHVHNNII